jgi:hypothetical protein
MTPSDLTRLDAKRGAARKRKSDKIIKKAGQIDSERLSKAIRYLQEHRNG